MQVPKSVLITGAGGYIGSYLTGYALGQGYRVVAVDTFQNGKSGLLGLSGHPELKILKKDLFQLTAEDLRGVSRVIHLAAIVGSRACEKDPEGAIRTNREATIHLCHIAGSTQIYFANTNIGYPKGASDESVKLEADGVYAKTKIEAEAFILAHGGVSFRLGSVFGVSTNMRDDLVLHFLIKEYYTKEELEVYDLNALRNFVHLDDVARALLWKLPYKRGEAYNLCLQRHYTKRELLNLILKEAGPRAVKEISETDPDKRDYTLSVEKIKKDADFVARVSVEESLPSLIKYYEFATL